MAGALVMMSGWVRDGKGVVHRWRVGWNGQAAGIGIRWLGARIGCWLRIQSRQWWALMAVTVVAVPCGMRAEVGSRTWKVHREVEDEQEASHWIA